MKLIFPILILLITCTLSCRKDVIDPPVDSPTTWTATGSSYIGDWNLSSVIHFESWWRIDSMDVKNTSELFLTLTDSVVELMEGEVPSHKSYYYGKLYEDGEVVDLMWNPNSILRLANPDIAETLFVDLRMQKFGTNQTFKMNELVTGSNYIMQKGDLPYVQDSLTYRVAFSSAPPNIGLMLGYTNSAGVYTVDTLKSGNWQWEKKVLQSSEIRDYKLEIVGATESFFDAIDSDYVVSVALQWSYESATGTHRSEKGLKDNISASFYTDGTVVFGTSPTIVFRLKYTD